MAQVLKGDRVARIGVHFDEYCTEFSQQHPPRKKLLYLVCKPVPPSITVGQGLSGKLRRTKTGPAHFITRLGTELVPVQFG